MSPVPASARTGEELVRVDGLTKSYGSTQAVRAASFTISAGEIHALCGHNGAGKSTVVKMLSGQEGPDDGSIVIGGRTVVLRDRQAAQHVGVALVDQELSIVPALSVAENLMLGDVRTRWLNRSRAAAPRFRALLDSVGLDHVRLGQPLAELGIGDFAHTATSVTVLIGPEGGLTDVEQESAIRAGFTPVRRDMSYARLLS